MAGSTPDPAPDAVASPTGQDGSAPDEAAAYLLLERLRWGGRPQRCPHCGTVGRCYFLAPADGQSRATRSGGRSARRVWKCGACRRQFSVLTGTVLEGTKVPVSTWVGLVRTLAADDRIPDVGDVRRRSGLGRDAARQVIRRWQAAAECEPLRSELRRARQAGVAQLFCQG